MNPEGFIGSPALSIEHATSCIQYPGQDRSGGCHSDAHHTAYDRPGPQATGTERFLLRLLELTVMLMHSQFDDVRTRRCRRDASSGDLTVAYCVV